MQTAADQPKPIEPSAAERFLAVKFEIDALLAKLTAKSADHFDVTPDELHWGHVGDVARIRDYLLLANDAAE